MAKRVIAVKDDSDGKFYKGDTLKVTHRTGLGVVAKNLTRPQFKRAVMLNDEFKEVKKIEVKRNPSHKVYFLGIPLFKIREVERNHDE